MNSHRHLYVLKTLYNLVLRVHSRVQSFLDINARADNHLSAVTMTVQNGESVSFLNSSTFCRGWTGFDSDFDLADIVCLVCDGWRWDV